MTEKKKGRRPRKPPVTEAQLTVGMRVKVKYSGFPSGKIIELRGPLGPKGEMVYRVRYKVWPKSQLSEILAADVEEILPPREKPATPPAGEAAP